MRASSSHGQKNSFQVKYSTSCVEYDRRSIISHATPVEQLLWISRRSTPLLSKQKSARSYMAFGEGTWRTSAETDRLHRSHFERRLLRFSPEQVFDVVAAVDKYKYFLPYCSQSSIIKHTGGTMEAELVIDFKLMQERYTSIVTLERAKTIKVVSKESCRVFHYLTNSWEFQPGEEPNTCWTSFAVSFKFKSELHRTVSDLFFSAVQKSMLSAFENRCALLYNNGKHQKNNINSANVLQAGVIGGPVIAATGVAASLPASHHVTVSSNTTSSSSSSGVTSGWDSVQSSFFNNTKRD